MNWNEILSKTDHTLLAPNATSAQIASLCEEALWAKTASVCIPPNRVREAKCIVGSQMKITTVLGFPNGYSTTRVKCFEAEDAICNGADELDVVFPVGFWKEGRFDDTVKELRELRASCKEHILKVIVETCLLTEDEKRAACYAVALAEADFIKTSTGFSEGGATVEDIRLFASVLPGSVRIKAAGGISAKEDAVSLLEAGASRLGSSRLVRLFREECDKEKTV